MLYIMRHGKTDWNLEHRMQGQTDIPLNDMGRQMASDAREKYKNVHFDICYCSPLSRARETAEIFLKDTGVPIIYDDRLIEMTFGEFEGEHKTSDIPGSPIYIFFKDPANYVATRGSESFEELFERTGNFLKEVVEPGLAEGKDILIIGHGAMNSSIVCQIKNRPISQLWDEGIVNCELMQLV